MVRVTSNRNPSGFGWVLELSMASFLRKNQFDSRLEGTVGIHKVY